MKSLKLDRIAITLLYIFSTLSLVAHSHSSKLFRRMAKNRQNFPSKLYQFALGLSTEIIGESDIVKCLPETWKLSDQPEEENFNVNIVTSSTYFIKVALSVGIEVNLVCLNTAFVTKLIDYYVAEAKKSLRRYIRRFLQYKHSSSFARQAKNWSFSGMYNTQSEAITTAASQISAGDNKVWKTVKNQSTTALDWTGKSETTLVTLIKSIIVEIFEKIIKFFDSIRDKIVAFFKSALMTNVQVFLKCVMEATTNATSKETLQGIMTKVKNIENYPDGWINTIVGIICDWEDLSTSIELLNSGITENNLMNKWNKFGRFLGKLLKIISRS